MGLELFDLTGRVAVVTGASRGLGQYLARALAQAGADLVITSRTTESLQEFATEIEEMGKRVLPLPLDVQDQQSIQDMAETAVDHYGRFDILVNNAGCNIRKPAVDVEWDDNDRWIYRLRRSSQALSSRQRWGAPVVHPGLASQQGRRK